MPHICTPTQGNAGVATGQVDGVGRGLDDDEAEVGEEKAEQEAQQNAA